ncbi:MAG: methyltransferase domain-containing protein [Thermoanaerobaculales bacterium]|nr:methyltransferase domain-containing protein [Thermoanaerobaculales bacterium]
MNQGIQTKLLYQQKQLPIFQNRLYDTEAEAKACPKGDMQLVEDQRTGLIYNAAFHPQLMVYDAQYQNEQAKSPLFQEHLGSVSHIIERFMERDSIVEVGCGKGFFLEMLLAKGFDITGFDPTYEGGNPRVLKHCFEPRVGFRARGLILRHVLEHIQDPFDFLLQLQEANGGHGRIYIEVPCFDWICERRAWFDVYYEHVNYFRISDFYRMFGAVIQSGRLFGGQYLFVVAELASLMKPEKNFDDCFIFPKGFTVNLGETRRAAIWGGASKGVIFALLKTRAGQPIIAVIDINPAKQGKYLPSTGLLVQSPAEALAMLPKGSTVYVMNSNYLEEIKEMSDNVFNYVEVDHE